MIYLDHNATTPVLPEVMETMMPFFREGFSLGITNTPKEIRETIVAVHRIAGSLVSAR